MKPKNYTIKKVVKETPSTNTFVLDKKLDAEPGQYYMVWVKGEDEIPISPSSINPGKLTVRSVGETTKKMNKLEEFEELGLRGCFGTSFDIKGEKILLIAGGVGAAPLLPLAKSVKDRDLTIALGAITKEELLFKEKFEELGELIKATEDGTTGYHGYITEPIFEKDLIQFIVVDPNP